jgi:hypothetical protein
LINNIPFFNVLLGGLTVVIGSTAFTIGVDVEGEMGGGVGCMVLTSDSCVELVVFWRIHGVGHTFFIVGDGRREERRGAGRGECTV